jgi:hypothetical protein
MNIEFKFMTNRTKITTIALLFVAGLLMTDCYRISVISNSHQKPTQLNLQFGRIGDQSDNFYNSYAENPDNDIAFNAYSRVTSGNRYQLTSLTNTINLTHLIICILDLPPPSSSA